MIDLVIDPGYAKRSEGSAVAVFDGYARRLLDVGYTRPVTSLGDLPAWMISVARVRGDVRSVVVEKPQVDARTADKVRTVVELSWQGAAVAYGLAGIFGATVVEVTPSRWKKSAHKPQHHGALLDVLGADELELLDFDVRARVEAAKTAGALDRWAKPGVSYYGSWKGHNLLDAVALGATHYGRLRL